MKKKSLSSLPVAGFDLSLTGTGAAFQQMDGSISFSTLSPKKKFGMERLDWIKQSIDSMVSAAQPKLIAFEDLAFAAHDRNHERAGLATLIRFMLWQKGIPYVLVAPTTLKKFVSGSGKAEKSMMLMHVFKQWGYSANNDNEADAIGLLQIARALTGSYTPANQAQKEVIKTVQKSNAEALKTIA